MLLRCAIETGQPWLATDVTIVLRRCGLKKFLTPLGACPFDSAMRARAIWSELPASPSAAPVLRLLENIDEDTWPSDEERDALASLEIRVPNRSLQDSLDPRNGQSMTTTSIAPCPATSCSRELCARFRSRSRPRQASILPHSKSWLNTRTLNSEVARLCLEFRLMLTRASQLKRRAVLRTIHCPAWSSRDKRAPCFQLMA